MLGRVIKLIKENELIRSGDTVLAAFSGGADSTALLLLLHELQSELDFTLAAAHFNHCIRKKTADMDEAFCAQLCESLSIPFYSGKEDVLCYAAKNAVSIETAARVLRYDFLYDVYKKTRASSIATAHHADDNAESILMHIIRGSGLSGLCGIRYRSEQTLPSAKNGEESSKFTLIRPLLDFAKTELVDYLTHKKQAWRMDETNLQAESARNILRLNIIPEIVERVNGSVMNNIIRLSKIASEDDAYLCSLAEKALEKASSNGGYLAEELIPLPSPVKKRALRLALFDNGALIDAEQAHIEALCELLEKQSGTGIDLPSSRARMVFGRLVIEKREKSADGVKIHKNAFFPQNGEKIEENTEKTEQNPVFSLDLSEGTQVTPLGEFRLSFIEPPAVEKTGEKEYNGLVFSDLNTAYMDLDKLNGEICVRTRLPGDRFHPVNSAWRMKLKDFFISRNVDANIRGSIPLVLCGGEIVFIPGFLVSDEVKLTEETRRVIRLEYLGKNNSENE